MLAWLDAGDILLLARWPPSRCRCVLAVLSVVAVHGLFESLLQHAGSLVAMPQALGCGISVVSILRPWTLLW